MTPGARVAAAIEVLDLIGEGQPAEKALTSWARRSRFAGSKDRAAVRDHVFSTLRNWRSDAVRGGGETGRARMIGRLRAEGVALADLFNGAGHAPAPLSEAEESGGATPTAQSDLWDLPDWLIDAFNEALGADALSTAQALKSRAPITVRVNTAVTTLADAQSALEQDGLELAPNPIAETALTITEGARKLRNSQAYQDGWVELQDGASQAVVSAISGGKSALDYCAGGGGKALALAAKGYSVTAHDIDFDRMRDLPDRARRAGAQIKLLATDMIAAGGPFDVVLVDAPCSGSGSWRRSPEAKWTLTPARVDELNSIQDRILDEVQGLVAPVGTLVYATCSVLKSENEDRLAAFLARNPGWKCTAERRINLSDVADGFYYAHLTRAK